MMLLRFGRVTGLRSIPLRKTQSLQFCDDKKISDPKNVEKETEKKTKIEKKESASEKLNKLLASMSTDDNLTLTKKVEIPQAGGRSKSKKSIKKEVEKEKKPKNLIEAAKGVANMLDAGADTHEKRKTESELLSKLLNHIDSDALTSETTVKSGTDFNLNNIIVGMKIDRKVAVQGDSDKRSTLTRSQYVKKALSGKRYEVDEEGRPRKPPRKHLTQPVPNSGSVNLFGEEPLGIFKDPTNLKDSPDMLKTWSVLEERELKLAVTHPPRNYFEKMVLWTDQGKLWKFPIDNEQGLEKEQEVDFSEHVFLDQYLEGWCPTQGPIRHFMELVCIGLSKNPYISAQEKQEHIYWFKDYFEQKKELLKDLIQEKGQQEELEQKQIKTKQINSITSLQNELLGVQQQMSSRASFHTKSSKSTDKTKFDTKCGIKSNEKQGDREIMFIGHSATWLPSEQGKVKIEDSVESNKKIVFVGHSATWIPTSPSKQRSTSFSTSAMQSAHSIQTERHCKENVSEIKKKNLKSVKDNTLQTNTNIQTTKQKNKEEGMKDGTKIIKQNKNAKGAAKIVESNVVFDKDTNSLKIVNSGQFDQKQESMTNKQNNVLDAIKSFKIPEECCDDIILSVPRYNLNKFITTVDPKSISDDIEKLVSEFEEKLETNKMKSNIQKTATVNSVKSNEQAPVSTSKNITCSSEQEKKITTLNSDIPEKVVIYDKPNNKLNVVSTKENPQVLEEAKRQDKTLDVLQAQAIADYALKHWLESDSTNKILKEKPVTTNSKDPDLPMDLQKKIQEIREYSNKMTRYSSKLPETTLNGKLTSSKTTANDLETTEMKTKVKKISSKPEMVLNRGNEEVAKVITDKELIFMGNMCYWIPKTAQRDSKIIPKESNPQSTVPVDQQNKLFDSSGVLFKTPNLNPKRKNEIVIGENVLSRIVIIDNRKNPVDLWKPEVNTKPSCPSTVQNSHSISNTVEKKSINKENQGKGNIIELFGVPVKYGKENIQLKETPVPLKNESKQKVTSKNQKSNLKSKPLFQAAQLEKHTEKYSNIENPTTTILEDGNIKKSFEPIKIVMNPIDLPKMTSTKTELKKEDSNKNKSIINKVDKEKDELKKQEPLKSMQDKVKKDLNDFGNKITGPQMINTSADSIKLKSPTSNPLELQHPVTSTIEQDNNSPVVEKVTTNPSNNLKTQVKSEKITSHNKENVNFSIEPNAVSTVPAANLEKKNSINTDLKTTVEIPNPVIIEKTKIDKEMKNLKEYKENLSNKPNIENFDTIVKSPSGKIVTDQIVPKSKEHFRKETSFSNTWSKMEPKPQTTSSIAQPETEVKNNFKENLKPKIKEEKPQKIPSVKNIENSKHLKNSVKQSTEANTPNRMTGAPDLKTPFKVKTSEFVKDNTPVRDSGKIATKSADEKDEILQKASTLSNNLKNSTTGFVVIEEKSKKNEKEHELSKAEIKNFKIEMNKNPQAKVVESTTNSSFVLIENTDVTANEKNVREDNKNHKNILNSKMNKDEKPSQVNKDPIILGPPKPKINETKRPEFVLVNSASQTYSLAEPLIEKKSDTINISPQTKLNEEKLQYKSKIEPVSSVDETKNLKNQKTNLKVTLKPVEKEVKIDSSLSIDKPKNTSTQALETERLESEHKMETILLKDKLNTNKTKKQLNQSNLHHISEKEKPETASASTSKPNTNISNASVKNLKMTQPLIKTEQVKNQDQTLVTNKPSSTKFNEPKSTDSITKIKTRSKEDVMETKSAITASATSTVQNVTPLTVSVPLEPSESKKTSNNSPTPLTSILSKNLEDIARKNGILKSQTQKGKSEPINNHIFSYPELTGTLKPQLEQPKLIVDKSLPNRFNVERQNTKQIPPKIETVAIEKPKIETSTVKLEPKLKAPTTSQSKPELLKALSPLERAYNKFDKKLDEIKKEIELGDLKTATTTKSSIADPKSLKEVRENFKATKEETTIEKSSESSSVKKLLNEDKTLNPKMDDENIIRKTYIPFSYHVTSPKEEPKVSRNKPKLESNATKGESPFLNLNFLKNYMKEKPNVDSTKAKSDSILKQVTNMIKEELFTYQEVPKETGKKTFKLAEESLASQPTFDGNKPIKPGTIYNQVKNMLKEDLTSKTKSGPQFSIPNSVIPGAAAKIKSEVTPSILNENNKKKSGDDTNLKMELEKSEQLVNKSEPKEDLTFKTNQEPIRAERPAVAFAETSVVPESVIVTETPPTPSKQSLNPAQNTKKQMATSLNKVKDVDQGTKAELNSDTSSDINKFNKDVVESINVRKSALTSKGVVNKSSITNSEESNTTIIASPLKPIIATKPLEMEINKSKNDEEELYKILGISNDKSSRKELKELPKPAESVMDRLRNYFEKSSPKLDPPTIIGASTTVTTNSDTKKVNEIEPLQAIKNKVEETKSDIQSQQSKVLTDSNATNFEAEKNEETITSENKPKIASKPTEMYETAKETQSDKFKNFIRNDSNNNSPYHMIKPLSLLEHLTNIDTEQVKIDHHMKLLSDSRSNSISNIELKSKSENSPRIQSPLLQAIEKDDVLMTPNPELVAKKTVTGKEKKSDSKSEDKPSTKSPETPQKSNTAKTVMSEDKVAAANEKSKNKKKEKVKEEEEEEENEDEIKKVLDKEMKKSDKQLNPTVFSKDSNDKTAETKIETKQPDSEETTSVPSKDTFRKDSVKPLDDNRSEPNHIIEGPGPSILDEETDVDPNKISNIKNKKTDEPPVTHLSPLNSGIFESEMSKPSSNAAKLPGSPNNISSDGSLHNSQQQPRTPESQIPLKIKPVEFSQQNQKFIKPSKPLIKHLNNVAKVNRNISSSVLEDFKIEMDRYNSAEATPEDKNKITLKIKYLTKIEPSESGGTTSESLTDSSKTKKIDDHLDKKPK